MITRIISNKKFFVSCADQFRQQADWLLSLLEKIEKERGAGFLEDGSSIQIGWSFIKIRREGDKLIVAEPNFSGDPFQETNDDLTCTLKVQAEQNDVLSALGLEGTPVPKSGDSGWYIGEVEQPQNELIAIYVYQLLQLRPAILQVLALPKGYIVVFQNNEIETILNEQNEPVK